MKKKVIITILIAALVLLGFYYATGKKNVTQNSNFVGTDQGDKAPSFLYTTIDGVKINSISLQNKIVIISSAAQWCPTCQEEAREFAPVYQEFKDKPVVFITVDIDPRDSLESIKLFKKTYNTPWYYTDAQGGKDIIQKYGMDRFEMTFIIDQNGKIAFNGDLLTHPEELKAKIQKLIK